MNCQNTKKIREFNKNLTFRLLISTFDIFRQSSPIELLFVFYLLLHLFVHSLILEYCFIKNVHYLPTNESTLGGLKGKTNGD